jgi:hypothetical protein
MHLNESIRYFRFAHFSSSEAAAAEQARTFPQLLIVDPLLDLLLLLLIMLCSGDRVKV